jgi:hypothetical protein
VSNSAPCESPSLQCLRLSSGTGLQVLLAFEHWRNGKDSAAARYIQCRGVAAVDGHLTLIVALTTATLFEHTT